jgi:hypothetical protein
MSFQCICQDWLTFEKISNSERTYLFVHGIKYTGPVFKYCPFCAKALIEDDVTFLKNAVAADLAVPATLLGSD